MASTTDTAEQIVDKVGGPGNISSLTHCATRLRFELVDASGVDQNALEAIPGVLGAVPQSGDRYQVVIGGAVQTVFNQINALPSMSGAKQATTDADIKAAERAKARGKSAWIDNFFEFLSDSFRPILGALLGSSLFITFMALMATLGVIPAWNAPGVALPASWAFVNLCWQCVFVFLPLLVAYNASKKVGADPWIGFAIMAVLMLPGFKALVDAPEANATTIDFIAGNTVTVVQIFGVPLTIFDYSSQVFPPLLMAAVLGPLWKLLNKVIPENVQLIFVPFLAMLVMIPLTAFIIGPFGVYVGAGLANVLAAINSFSPFIFAIVIPLLYPFMVPLGLHWPINAVMLLNIQTLGYDFIQGPMGAWNFACFGATAGVLVLSVRDKDNQMRQTATGALAAGLLGGISEPSLYGIHLRFKRIYPRMLVGCFIGGLIIGLFGGVHASGFAFTSLLTIPIFTPTWVYAIAIAAAFVTAMTLVIISDYRTPEQRAEFLAERDGVTETPAAPAAVAAAAPVAAGGVATLVATRVVIAPVAGRVVPITEVNDKVFASKALGDGVGIVPTDGHVVAPVAGVLVTVPDSGHAFGIKTDDGVEVLVHVGIDTVQLEGKGFQLDVTKDMRVEAGDLLAKVDLDLIKEAGYDTTTIVVVINTAALKSVQPVAGGDVKAGDTVIDVEA